MGTDIYPWVEYDHGDAEPFTTEKSITSITEGPFYLGRDYRFFALLAGVRAGQDGGPIIPPRGIPDIVDLPINNRYYMRIVDETDKQSRLTVGPHRISRPEAEYFILKGSSHYHPLPGRSKSFVSNPEFHHPGWLYYDELKTVVRQVSILEGRSTPHPGDLLLRVMEHVSAQFKIEYDRIRFVFWFHG